MYTLAILIILFFKVNKGKMMKYFLLFINNYHENEERKK